MITAGFNPAFTRLPKSGRGEAKRDLGGMRAHWRVRAISGLTGVAFIGAAAFVPFTLQHEPLADLTPNTAYDDGPFTTPADCLRRTWRVGEFMPAACQAGQIREGRRIGLDSDEGMRGVGRWRTLFSWIRNGDDALLVACPPLAPCKVFQVVRNRFSPSAQDSPTTSEDGRSFRNTPLSYRLGERWPLPWGLPVGCILLVLALLPTAMLEPAQAEPPRQ